MKMSFDYPKVNPDNRYKYDSTTTPVSSPIKTRSKSGYVAKHPTRYND